MVALLAIPGVLQAQWRLEGWFGDAWNAGLPLTVEQEGQPELTIDPDWSTRPWRPTWYYAARVSRWSGSTGWGFEYIHHKLYLDNPGPEVTTFRITNGVNHLLIERLWKVGSGMEVGVGAGPMFAVPISTVRGLSRDHSNGVFGSRYELSGGTLMATAAKSIRLLPHTHGSLAAKLTVTSLDVSIAQGSARTTAVALHLQYGIGFSTAP